jgi:Xaa-Pro aminopeptidase
LLEEVTRIRRACAYTAELFTAIGAHLCPGVTGVEIADFAHRWMRERDLEPAWDYDSCPAVPIGPRSPVGHAPAADIAAEAGDLVFCDVGVVCQGYRSDMQRTWYLLKPGEDRAPAYVQDAWRTLRKAVDAGVKQLRPGAKGWQVDAAARKVIARSGYQEPPFAFGHHLGANAHDGGVVLGPRWERYGRAPSYVIEADQVFAVEYGFPTRDPYRGWVSVEDDLRITPDGVEWLCEPQREIGLIRK